MATLYSLPLGTGVSLSLADIFIVFHPDACFLYVAQATKKKKCFKPSGFKQGGKIMTIEISQ